jgi:mono/diheme cytochrome c family protein
MRLCHKPPNGKSMMNKRRVIQLFGGPVALVMVSAAAIAASGMANGLDASAHGRIGNSEASAEARVHVAQADASAMAAASYASEQADRGEDAYEKSCVECHGDDLRGGLLGGPPLRGVSFEEKYFHGAPAGVLFEVMSTTMPPNAPGRLSEATYADIMAYVLKRNGMRPGAPLPSDVDALYELTLEK